MKHPGSLLIEKIREKSLTQKEFSLILWKSVSELNELIKWKRNITIQWDLLLSQVLWSPEKYWIHKQIDYDYFLAKQEYEKVLSKTKLEESVQTEEIPRKEKDSDSISIWAIEELESISEDFIKTKEAPREQENFPSIQAQEDIPKDKEDILNDQEDISQNQEKTSVKSSKNKKEIADIFRNF